MAFTPNFVEVKAYLEANLKRSTSKSLPSDVIGIIRELSRPLLRDPSGYKKAMAELGLQDWPQLKAKLSTNDAEEVMKYLHSYLAAHRLNIEAKRYYKDGGSNGNVRWTKANYNKIKVYRELITHL
jgi:hypothetical protein